MKRSICPNLRIKIRYMKDCKSKILQIILCAALSISMAGCGSGVGSSKAAEAGTTTSITTTTTAAKQEDATSSSTSTTEDIPDIPQEPLLNLNNLTGEYTMSDEGAGKRPVAIMINNIRKALPQYGISDADLLYECPVEGGITRLMAIYGDPAKIPDVCSIRSCRYYYPIFALSYDAVYVHWGKDETIAKDTLSRLDVDRLDGYSNQFIFARDEERHKNYSSEHCGYYKGALTLDALERSGIRSDILAEKNKPIFTFSDEPAAPSGSDCKDFTVYFSDSYYSGFTFDSANGVYLKQHSGKPHMDSHTNKQLSFTNVFVLETETSVINRNNGLISLEWTGGDGYYVSMGKAVPVKWSKADEFSDLVITNADGTPLTVNTGKSYFGFTNKLGKNFKVK